MAPLLVMLVAWAVARVIGLTGVAPQADSWSNALRFGLAAMFAFTAISHFHPRTRPDLIRMVPANLPSPALLVTATGVLELVGAIGLVMPQAATAAAYGLAALLVAMFPANVRAARVGLTIAGRRATPLLWRLPLQLFWILALLWVAMGPAQSGGTASDSEQLRACRHEPSCIIIWGESSQRRSNTHTLS